ncbi:MAG TPA: hypothetical protein VFD10_03570 [Atribacterota bacterium]|nr:hypothetical protein [Atribacterota bacterium]
MTINIIYDFLILHFIEPLAKLNNFPNIIQGIGLALLTILIPLAIAVLADIYQKRKGEEKDFVYLDLHVILDNVFKIKLLIVSVFLIFLPMFFWEILIGLYKLIVVPFIFTGIILLVNIIFKVSRWVKGNVFVFRFSYLQKLNRYNDLEIVWRSVWQVENINIQNERKFFQIFSSTINRLLNLTEKSENLKTISKLLNDFYNSINKRSIAALNEDIFPKILDWHFNFWQKENELLGKKLLDRKGKLDKWSNFSEISRILNDIFNNIEERSLKERMAYSFFDHFKRHAEHYKKELVERNKTQHYYIDSLLSIFCLVFFENINKSPKKPDIWNHYFPEKWKVKKNNFENIISRSLCGKFLKWARDIILEDKKKFSRDLGDISLNLFPEVEPSLWINILLLFVFSHYRDNRMKMESIIRIEHFWNFGFIGRVRIGDNEESLKKIEEAEIKNTFELAFQLFKEQFSKDNLEKYIKSLEELGTEYKKDLDKEKKRLRLLDAFSEMLKFLELIGN